MFNSAIRTLSAQADKLTKEGLVMATKYGKEAQKKMNAAMGKEQIVTIGSRQMRVLDLLAEGGYAYVYKAEDVTTGQVLALKRMLIQDEENVGLADMEIDIMKKLAGRPFVIQILGSTKRKIEQPRATEYFVLMELCTGGTLMDLITRQQKRKLDEGRLASIFYQIAVAVSHLHKLKPPVAHRDLKIENVLIGSDGEMRLCDFGSCTTRAQAYLTREEMTQEEERIQRYSTSMYRAPEMVDLYKKEVINEKVDIWALGCILYTLAFYVQPFQEGGNLQIIGGTYSMPEDSKYSKQVPLLIKKMLSLSPKKRPDIRKLLLLLDKWIAELRKNGEPVNIPQSKDDKKKKKKKKKSGDGDDDSEDSDESEDEEEEEEEENGEEESKKAKRKPAAMQTSGFAGDDFATDFDAHSPAHSARAPQPHMSSSASFPSFPQPAGGAASSASSPPAALPFPPHPRTLSNPPPPLSQPAAKPAAVFDMSAFADALVVGPPGSAAAATSPSPSAAAQQRLSPPPAVSPRGLPPSGSVPSGFDFFGGSASAAQPASASSSPLALGKLPPPMSPTAAKAKAAAKVAAPASKSPTPNGGAAGKKPHAPVKKASAAKKEEDESSEESDSDDSDDTDDSDEEDESDDEDDRRSKGGSAGKQPLRKTASKK